MRTPLANTIFYGVIFLLTLTSTVEIKAQSTLPRGYLEIWDEDGNKKITHAEFYQGMSSVYFFEEWDTKKDAKLDRQEVYSGLERIQSLTSGSASLQKEGQIKFYEEEAFSSFRQDFASIFKEADLNRNESLNMTEFYTFIFRQLDEDENGILSFLEANNSRLSVFSAKNW